VRKVDIHLRTLHVLGVALVVEQDVAPDPTDVGILRPGRIMHITATIMCFAHLTRSAPTKVTRVRP